MKNFFLLFVTTVFLSSFTVYGQDTAKAVKPPARDTTQFSQTALHDTASAGNADTPLGW